MPSYRSKGMCTTLSAERSLDEHRRNLSTALAGIGTPLTVIGRGASLGLFTETRSRLSRIRRVRSLATSRHLAACAVAPRDDDGLCEPPHAPPRPARTKAAENPSSNLRQATRILADRERLESNSTLDRRVIIRPACLAMAWESIPDPLENDRQGEVARSGHSQLRRSRGHRSGRQRPCTNVRRARSQRLKGDSLMSRLDGRKQRDVDEEHPVVIEKRSAARGGYRDERKRRQADQRAVTTEWNASSAG